MSFFQFVSDQRTTLPLIPTEQTCKGKTFIVTGSNAGLGSEAAKHLVGLRSSRVILAVRSLSKGDEAKRKIEAETGQTGIAEVWQLDLGSYESVIKFAEKVKTLDRLDALIANASLAVAEIELLEGLETTLAVNVVGNFLLAALVLPKLEESAKEFGVQTHLTMVGSGTAFHCEGNLEKVKGDILTELSAEPGSMTERYPVSKLLQLYGIRALAAANPVKKTGVIINYVNPGLCYSDLTRNAPFLRRTQINIMRLVLARTTEVGSRTLLHGAFAGDNSHGCYLSECTNKQNTCPEWITNNSGGQIQKRVWESVSKRLDVAALGSL